MFLVIDLEGNLTVYRSAEQAEAHMETNDFGGADEEYEMCDDSGLRYVANILDHPSPKWSANAFEIVPTDTRDPQLPFDFLSRTRDFSSHIPWVKTVDDARRELWPAKA
jgi:hypothetical protein